MPPAGIVEPELEQVVVSITTGDNTGCLQRPRSLGITARRPPHGHTCQGLDWEIVADRFLPNSGSILLKPKVEELRTGEGRRLCHFDREARRQVMRSVRPAVKWRLTPNPVGRWSQHDAVWAGGIATP